MVQAKQAAEQLNHRFQNIADNVPGVIYEYRLSADGHTSFPWASSKITEIYGCSVAQAKQDASHVFTIIEPEDLPALKRSITDSAINLKVWHTTYRVNHPTLGQLLLEGSSTPSLQPNGDIVWYGFIRDITDLHKDREALRLAGQVLSAMSDGVLILDAQGVIKQTNPALERMTGFTLEQLQGKNLAWFNDEYATIQTTQTEAWRGESLWKTNNAHIQLPVLVSISPVYDDHGRIGHYVVIVSDISALKAKQHELDQLAYYDALTGLPNRRLVSDRLEQSVAQARRSGEQLAVAMLDLDEFKPVNDTYGHEAGDVLLIDIARRLQSVMRDGDTVARLGGDEFTLIFRNIQNDAPFARIIEAAGRPVDLPQGQVHVSASMGVAYLNTNDTLSAEQLLRQADIALYRSKDAGRNRYTIF